MAAFSDSNGGSPIRVFVRFVEPNVFAGEEVRCRITFRNVAATTTESLGVADRRHVSSGGGSSSSNSLMPPGARHVAVNKGVSAIAAGGKASLHRSTLSLNVPPTSAGHGEGPGAATRQRAGSSAAQGGASWERQRQRQQQHVRSPSVVSDEMASEDGSSAGMAAANGTVPTQPQRRPSKGAAGHVTQASSQLGGGRQTGPSSGEHHLRTEPADGAWGHRADQMGVLQRSSPATLPHRGLNVQASSSTTRDKLSGNPVFVSESSSTSELNSPGGLASDGVPSPRSASGQFSEFRFPALQSPGVRVGSPSPAFDEDLMSPRSGPGGPDDDGQVYSDAARPTLTEPPNLERSLPTAKILSATTGVGGGTPRSSGEFYSMSNHSSETLASEYVTPQQLRPSRTSARQSPHARRTSALGRPGHQPEMLMMGYAQIQGSFTLDGSLVDLSPFEHVKRKAVVGGQGAGGVVGLDPTPSLASKASSNGSKRDSGLIRGALGWGAALGSSIGGMLLGSAELSSIREMRTAATNSRAGVPILSTPQSILFVDLRLAPGESREFDYAFRLPRGLPPTHRGRAIKIQYGIVIGVQRPAGVGGGQQQQITSVTVPFRVLGSVNAHGEILGHDLMEPYVMLRDQAKVQEVGGRPQRQADGGKGEQLSRPKTRSAAPTDTLSPHMPSSPGGPGPSSPGQPTAPPPSAQLTDFLGYVDDLLNHPRHSSGAGLLSPTATGSGSPSSTRRPSVYFGEPLSSTGPLPTTAKEAIDLAVLRSASSTATAAGSGSSSASSATRFEIARDGLRVAVVLLARAAYRVGERVLVTVDFDEAEIPCLALVATLESTERIVDPTVALRSEASVARATRRVWAARADAVLYGRRAVFSAGIPAYSDTGHAQQGSLGKSGDGGAGSGSYAGATPEFVTSAVALEWCVKLEFVVPVAASVPSRAPYSPQTQSQGGSRPGSSWSTGTAGPDAGGHDGDEGDKEAEETKLRSSEAPSSPRATGPAKTSRSQPQQPPHPLLEELSRDERGGLVLVAAERIDVESFEVSVPIRVYGAVCPAVDAPLHAGRDGGTGLPI